MPTPPRRRAPVALLLIVALLLAVGGVAAWWFTSGRWTQVPSVAAQDRISAENAIRDADLEPVAELVRHNDVPANTVIETRPAAGSRVLLQDRVTVVVSIGLPVVPAIAPGTSVPQAEKALADVNLKPRKDDAANVYNAQVPKGTVVRVDPAPGTQLRIDTQVTLVLSKGPPPKPVPDVTGLTRDQALATLTNAGFAPADGGAEFSATLAAGLVVRTSPVAGTVIDASGSNAVSVVVSNSVTVPDLTGQTLTAAQTALASLGLTMSIQLGQSGDSTIVFQSPPAGSLVQSGSAISVFATPL